ncbi:MAG: hypothetical protein K8R35_09595 [Bacteroidales bacterium]|nr:hypothetical protein [Bacteroidales bacterium]
MAKGQESTKKKTCFIIMPISTPENYVERYNNDPEHFLHVHDTLMVPAIKEAGLTPVTPISKGSELIHAEIIDKLWSSDYVLCDMSILNANVFFELGIRTAINKPVILVKDKFIKKPPFDVSGLSYYNYDCTLKSWEIIDEIKKLSKHIIETEKKNSQDNAIWKYFGIQTDAILSTHFSDQDKLDVILSKLDSLSPKQEYDETEYVRNQLKKHFRSTSKSKDENIFGKIMSSIPVIIRISPDPLRRILNLGIKRGLTSNETKELHNIMNEYNYEDYSIQYNLS